MTIEGAPHAGEPKPGITLGEEDRFMIDVAAELGEGDPTVERTADGAVVVHIALNDQED